MGDLDPSEQVAEPKIVTLVSQDPAASRTKDAYMRVSQFYGLNRSQGTLDFVDVDIDTDRPIFLDPRAIRLQRSAWAEDCQALLQSFFTEALEAIAGGDSDRLIYLFSYLGEPNETHLGYSTGESRGTGLGSGERAENLAQTLSRSRAAQTGLLQDLEDTAFLIPGIDRDVLSDMTTQILRGALIGYTQRIANYYGIELEEVYSGPVWNPNELDFQEDFVELPRPNGKRLLLVPKSIVRQQLIMNKEKYFNGYLAPYLEAKELDANSTLVRILKNKTRKVAKKDLRKKYPANKLAIVDYTLEFPEALQKFREQAGVNQPISIDVAELSAAVGAEVPDYQALLDDVVSIAPGSAGASMFHRAAEKLLTALFNPSLGNFQLEAEIHEGRKRIDILYDNLAFVGVFRWLNDNYRCPVIPVECKNYSEDPANPEIDQLAGRLSNDRGWIGVMVCRTINGKDRLLARCRDTAKDGRGYLVVLDDEDLGELVREAQGQKTESLELRSKYTLIRRRVQQLIG